MKNLLISTMSICRNNSGKALLLIVFLFLASASFSQKYLQLYPNPIGEYYKVVDFANANDGLAIQANIGQSNAGVAHTTDGGVTWTYSLSDVCTSPSLAMGSSNTAFRIRGNADAVDRTTDAGYSWQTTSVVGTYLQKVSMFGPNIGVCIIAGAGGLGIFYTNDTGKTWLPSQIINGLGYFLSAGVSMGSPSNAVVFCNSKQLSPYVFYTNDGGKNWMPGVIDPLVSNPSVVESLDMVTADIGYMALSAQIHGPAQEIVKTTDGGKNWARCDNGTSLPFQSTNSEGVLSFFNERQGAFLLPSQGGSQMSISVTSDGGVTWILKAFPVGTNIRDIKYISDNVIVAVGSPAFLRSTDAGTTWKANQAYIAGDASKNSLRGIAMNSLGVGVAVDFGKAIARTTNKGNDWSNSSISANDNLNINGVAFASDNIIVAVADSGKFLRSTDAGITWEMETLPSVSQKNLLSVDFLAGSGLGVAVGDSGTIIRTVDYGATWDKISGITTKQLLQVTIHKSDRTYIYTYGAGGTVLYSIDGGGNWSDMSVGLPSSVTIYSMTTLDDQTLYASGDSSSGIYRRGQTVFRYIKNQEGWKIMNNSFIQGARIGRIKMLSSSTLLLSLYAPGGFGSAYYSTDAGSSWSQEKNFGNYAAVSDIYLVSPTNIYLTVSGQLLFRRIQGDYASIGDIDVGAVEFEPVVKSKDTVIRIINTGTDTLRVSNAVLKDGTSFSLIAPFLTTIPPGVEGMQGIRFSPTGVGILQDSLFLFSNGFTYSADTIIVNGVGTSNNAKIQVTDSVLNYGQVKACEHRSVSFTIMNSGTAELDVTMMSFVGNTGQYTFLDPTSFLLQPSASKIIHVRFDPIDTGFVIDSLKINSTDAKKPISYIKLIGYARMPKFVLEETQTKTDTVNFGNIVVNDSLDRVVHFVNSGNDTLVVSSVTEQGDSDDVFSEIPVGLNLQRIILPGMKDSVLFRFLPRHTKEYTATITVVLNTCEQAFITLKGSALAYKNPESVVYDDVRRQYLISNTASGSILSRSLDGAISLFYSGLISPRGMTIVDKTLYVADRNFLHGIYLENGSLVTNVIVGSGMLIDITADTSGNLYITDRQANTIYQMQIAGGAITLITDQISAPSGIIFNAEHNSLIVCTSEANYPLREYYLTDNTWEAIHYNYSSIYGITEDKLGNYYVSSWADSSVYRFDHEFSNSPEVVSKGHAGPAGIFYNKMTDTLVVPNFNGGTVDFIGRTSLGVQQENKSIPELILGQNYPNPFSKRTIIDFSNVQISTGTKFIVTDILGRIVFEKNIERSMPQLTFDGSLLHEGIYNYSLKDGVHVQSRTMMLVK